MKRGYLKLYEEKKEVAKRSAGCLPWLRQPLPKSVWFLVQIWS